ncbi:PLP-dependent aminotransferase family protein [Actinomadura flavalba]|uniref:MocR-like pyridoxine biosynthesis transcription factor PdxR n=1 Tax=Actinomadura flavalba TaxID=1120938 RepID=UPI0003760C70|nr:PLP-dependent aminotransferase family protein [Actinomadura flavalba]
MDVPLVLDRSAAEPLGVQLVAQLRAALTGGRLRAGERLPSTRALAATLGVGRAVVTQAYEQLYAEGWLEGRHGSGTYVSGLLTADPVPPPPPHEPFRTNEAPAGTIDLRAGIAWTGALDTPAWRRAWRAAAVARHPERADVRGLPALRELIAGHVRRGRGVPCDASRVLVTRGATHGLDLLAGAVLRPGDRAGVEEPGYRRAKSALRARGIEVVPCPVDEHGLIVDALPDGLRLVYTTPSHQFPLGGVLPVPRRQALLAYARRNGALVAEDDYDGEFRYDVAPLPALYGLDPDVVVYLGTTGKTLTSALGVGWLIAEPSLVADLARHRTAVGDRTPALPQEALRTLLDGGDVDRHVRRMRAEYARRRAVVAGALHGLRLRGDTAGLHLVVELGAAAAVRVTAEAGRRGVLTETVASHGASRYSGLVVGYGGAATHADLRAACAVLRELAVGRGL